ncbi:hypothetical protein [Enterococcus phage GVEsP-1]|jgi:hypothetical protein|uniref:Uncharacterized protein n=2 Tax=Schiekvirus EfV12 TaxID=2734045 RepID=A0A3B8E546_9CAUD|nr:hypothetical protein HOU42_gp072 [Enterococcus phage EfV12-phi1]AYJ73435.1 hypothetical protein EFV12PHI1_26 [Enterococcus phage EfV12-phi1]QYS24471.1 hypothetical protein [Enterococcus phage GVEsP-1]
MKKLANECIGCRSRFCANGIVSVADNGASFNEIACPKHTDMLYKKADEVLGKNNGVQRLHVSTTGCLTRRILPDKINEMEKWRKEHD